MRTTTLVLITAGALLATAALFLRAGRPSSGNSLPISKPDASSAATTAATPRDASGPAAAITHSHAARNRAVTASTPVLNQPQRTTLAQAFPRLAETVADWRDYQPEQMTVSPAPGIELTFTRESIAEDGPYVVWTGRNPRLPGASLVGVSTERGYDAVVVVPYASQFSFHVRGSTVLVTESAPGEESCEAPHPEAGIAAAPPHTDWIIRDLHDHTSNSTTPLNVDVLFLYDSVVLTVAKASSPDPVGFIDAHNKAMLETCNVVLRQSGVENFVWRYLGSIEAPAYPETGAFNHDLAALTPPAGLIGDWVTATRDHYGADQIVLSIGKPTNLSGIAWGTKQKVVARERASAVIPWSASYRILAHELAHNFGCHHNRENSPVDDPAFDGDGVWSYGFRWDDPNIRPPYTPTSGTVMSYAGAVIPYFSNPNLTIDLTGNLFTDGRDPNGNFGRLTIGHSETHPRAANNARVLREGAAAIAALSTSPGLLPPVIVRQPQAVGVSRGNPFTLTIAAAGVGVSYQWRKAGEPIVGATSPTFSRGAAADSDAGSYTVSIGNAVGTVTSESVSVVVDAPPPQPPPPGGGSGGGSGGGGGGGGAPSLGFLVALSTLLAARRITRRAA